MFEPVMMQLQGKLSKSISDSLRFLLSSKTVEAGSSVQAEAAAFDGSILTAAQHHQLDPTLLKAVVQTEFNSNSSAGPRGSRQLMDASDRQLGENNPCDSAESINSCARFLRDLLDRFNDNEVLALAAYNAGPVAVERWGGVPPYSETQVYVPHVLALRTQYLRRERHS